MFINPTLDNPQLHLPVVQGAQLADIQHFAWPGHAAPGWFVSTCFNPWKNIRQRLGLGWQSNFWYDSWIFMICMYIYPLVNIQKAIENGHRNSGFTQQKWWFSIVMLVYQRVYMYIYIYVLRVIKLGNGKPPVIHERCWPLRLQLIPRSSLRSAQTDLGEQRS